MENTSSGFGGSDLMGVNSQFFRLPKIDQDDTLNNLNVFCSGNADKITDQMAKSALDATICPGCVIFDGIKRTTGPKGEEILMVPIKTAPLQFETIPISVEFLRSLIRTRNQPLAQPA